MSMEDTASGITVVFGAVEAWILQSSGEADGNVAQVVPVYYLTVYVMDMDCKEVGAWEVDQDRVGSWIWGPFFACRSGSTPVCFWN